MENILPIIVLVAVIGVLCWLIIGFVRDIKKYRKDKNLNKEDKNKDG